MTEFESLLDGMNRTLVDTFGKRATATFYPAVGGGPIAVDGILFDPELVEGLPPTNGSNVSHFFVNAADISPTPKNGDKVSIGSVSYDIGGDPEADSGRGLILKLRRNA